MDPRLIVETCSPSVFQRNAPIFVFDVCYSFFSLKGLFLNLVYENHIYINQKDFEEFAASLKSKHTEL